MRSRFFESILPPALVCAAALGAVLPLLLHGPSCGHDFDFHLLSWLEAANQFAHGGYPHWAFTPAFNAGEPRFIFYPPISWTLGAVLGLLLPWSLVPAVFTWVALSLSGLTMLHVARRYASASAATLAATLYLANPYMLFTAYERTAYAELLAAAFLPLLFAAILSPQAPTEVPSSAAIPSPKRRAISIAFPLALLWLTNAPAAVMGSYALALLAGLRLASPTAWRRRAAGASATRLRLTYATTVAAGTALGLALAAFYIVPAAFERRFVQIDMAVIEGMRPADHFLFHRMGLATPDALFHDAVVRTASWIALGMLGAIAIAALAAVRRRQPLGLSLLVLAGVIAFLLTPPSLFLWHHMPQLQFLQFPWRLTTLLAVILAILAAQAISRLSIPYAVLPLLCLLLAATLIVPAYRIFHQRCDAQDALPTRMALFHSNQGTEATDEYTPVGADGDALQPGDPPYWLTADVDGAAPRGLPAGPAPDHLVLSLDRPEFLVLDRRAFPSWTVERNGKPLLAATPSLLRPGSGTATAPAPPLPHRADGLIAIPLAAGPNTIDIAWQQAPAQDYGVAISLLAGLATLPLLRRPHATA